MEPLAQSLRCKAQNATDLIRPTIIINAENKISNIFRQLYTNEK